MTVDIAPAPPHVEPAPLDDEERVHTGLFWLAIIAVLIGSLIVGASRVWAAQADKMVTFPAFDQTVAMSGTVTFHADPATFVPLTTATTADFEDSRRTQTPGLLAQHATVLTTDAISVDGRRSTVTAQYVLDVNTLRHLRTALAWSFTGTNSADRSHAYAVNLPFNTGPGPYQIWLNEADRAYTATQVGQPFEENGLTVIRLQGHLDATPVDPAFIADLSRSGLPAGLTLHQLQHAISVRGVAVDPSFPTIPAGLSPDEVAALDDPIPLDYTMTADSSLLVEPRTGTIVAVEKMDETFTARLDSGALSAVEAVTGKHPGAPGMAANASAVAALAAVPEGPAFDLRYAQTPASVKSLSGWAAAQRDWANRITRVIPTTLFAVGLVVIGLGALAGVVAWRRRNTVYAEWWEEDEEE